LVLVVQAKLAISSQAKREEAAKAEVAIKAVAASANRLEWSAEEFMGMFL
jgi:hypothetical protein